MDLLKDGLIVDLYYLLWKKEDFMKSGEDSFKINIPNTLVIKENQPFAWYFTDSQGFLRRKRTKKLSLSEIYRVFGNFKKENDVVAYFLHQNKQKPSNPFISIRIFFNLIEKQKILLF